MLELSGLKLRLLKVDNRTARFDLHLSIEDTGGLALLLEYNADLFDEETCSRLLAHFQQLLRSIIADPALPISSLPLFSTPQLLQLLRSSNADTLAFRSDLCLHQLFEVQAAAYPDRIALVTSSAPVGLSYQLLNERANQLAHLLLARGISHGSLVGICMDRSAEMLVAMLATLKAGAAYVPLDPSFPLNRLRFMLSDAQVSLLLTEERLLADLVSTVPAAAPLPDSSAARPSSALSVLCLDRDWPAIASYSTANPAQVSVPGAAAYVIYTSGSTGQPKGVVVTHRSVVNFLCSMERRPGLSADDRLLAVTTISFDIAALELFLPLMVGATVVLASGEETDPVLLLALLKESRATVMQATPAMWRMLIDSRLVGYCRSQDAIRRRSSFFPARAAVERARRRVVESLRADRDHDLVNHRTGGRGEHGNGRDWTANQQHRVLCAEQSVGTGA